MSFNQVTLIGNVGKDPEIRTLNSGKQVASFSLATSERWRDKGTGEKREQTDWHNVVVFNENLIKVIEQYVLKGSSIMVQGQLKTRKWQDQEGKDRYTTEVVLQNFNSTLQLLGKREGGGGASADDKYSGYDRGGGGGEFKQDARGNTREDFSADLDDEIPF